MTDIIQAQNLRFAYGRNTVLKGLSFTVQSGEIIGLIGENGAGKTTLLKVIMGTLPADGAATVFGMAPGHPDVRSRIGTMLQGDIFLQGVTTKELLSLYASYAKNPIGVAELLSELELADIANRYLNRLSGGQLRRVTFALAMIMNPDLIFLDEPTVGMDVNARKVFWDKINELRGLGKTIVITSHYLEEIQEVADRLLILHEGRLIFNGTFTELQTNYRHTIVSFATSLRLQSFTSLPGVVEATVTRTGEIKLVSIDGDTTIHALQPVLNRLNHLFINQESLADIFTQLTNQTEEEAS